MIVSVNGFPPVPRGVLAMRRDPDRGTIELEIDRRGAKLTQVYVMR